MKQISLTKGFGTIVDDDLYDYLNQWKWHYNDGYAERKEYKEGKQIHIRMHHIVFGKKIMLDHWNNNTLDNQRKNLRPTNHSLNAMNMRKHRGKSVYKGVTKDGKLWRTTIWKNNKCAFRISMPNERWAAMAYDLNATVLFGEYARLNFSSGERIGDERQ